MTENLEDAKVVCLGATNRLLCQECGAKSPHYFDRLECCAMPERGCPGCVKHEKATITVCDKCLQASCWQGIFMCQESTNAGVTEKTRDELLALNLENPCYWG